MSAAPSEPEKYSIDEMMDRLKNSSSENPADGELVTREDGTQAIRVRKRKRRSSQPHKEQLQRTRKARILQVAAALVLVFVAVVTIAAGVIYANSSPFRKGLEQKIAQASGANIELTQFRMNPKTANAGNLVLQWPEGNFLQKLEVRGLNSEIFPASFLGKSMTGEETSAIQGTLSLRIPDVSQPARSTPAAAELPVRFNRYRIPALDVSVGNPKAPLGTLTKSEATLAPLNVNGRPELSLYQGELAIPGWPKLRMDRAMVEFRGQDTDVIGLRVLHESDNRGSLELEGTVSPYKPDQASTLNVRLDSFQLSGLTGSQFGKLLSGRLDTRSNTKSNFLTFYPTAQSSAVLDVSFQSSPSSEFTMQGFPFLFALAQALDDEWFEQPIFDVEATGMIHREDGNVTLKDLNIENKARMSVKGSLTISPAEKLSGRLQIGIPETMVASARIQRLGRIFGPTTEGFRWVTLEISGSTSAPMDNFKDLYSAATAPGEKRAPSTPEGGSSFEDLTRPR